MENPFKSADWTEESLNNMWNIIKKVAVEDFGLDFYNPYFEIVTFEEILHIYTTSFPIMFNHWSFGKDYEENYKLYKNNRMSIAYEVIFNTNPALCYLLETNTSTMQALVMSHAAIGHSSFFKTNEFIRENTKPSSIISYLKNVREYVEECERNYSPKRVERILDICKSFRHYGIDRAEKIELSREQLINKKRNREKEQYKDFDMVVEDLVNNHKESKGLKKALKEENVLKYIAKFSPSLKQWERDLILMFCNIQQYFYPQIFTKLMNEGYASFWHYQLMNRLYDLGYIDEGNLIEFLESHTGVLCQRDHDEPGYGGINPYSLGFAIFNDIKRICEKPTDEDKFLFPGLIGKNWIEEVKFAAANFKDESFILQYLSPKVVRDFKLFKYKDDSVSSFYSISAVHADEDFKEIRKELSQQYNAFKHLPLLYIEGNDINKTRSLSIACKETKDVRANYEQMGRALVSLKELWNFPIKFKYITWQNEIIKGEVTDVED